MGRFFTASSFFVMALAAPFQAFADCSQTMLAQISSKVANAQRQLLDIEAEEMDTSVPSSTQQEIRAMKDALVGAADGYVRCLEENAVDVKMIETRLAKLVGANQPKPSDNRPAPEYGVKEREVYGADLRLVANRPAASMNLISIEISFSVMCGRDSMLLIYELRKGKWSRAINWRSPDYDTVAGAYGDFFEYVIIPHGTADEWVAAVAHGHPWCTSRWSGFGLDLIKPGDPTLSGQRVLLHKNAGYDRAPDSEKDFPTLRKEPDGFELRVRDSSFDTDVFSRAVIYRYQLTGEGARRVQPTAMNGRDFVEVWIESAWEEAKDWSASENRKSLSTEHARIQKLMKQTVTEILTTFSFGAVRACSDDRKRFQVELDQSPGTPTYFQIREGQNSFTMLGISADADPHCKSADLMKKR